MAEQAHWEVALYKARAHATGPRTPEGKARSAKNLEGHPTPEEALRTRFNALKHGLRARVATWFPAKPGKYPHCSGCAYFDGCEKQVACQARTELFLRHRIAWETRDPSLLADLRADLHANVQAIIDDIVLAIARTGVEVRQPQWYYDKDGTLHIAEYTDDEGNRRVIEEIRAHPLLKHLSDMIAKLGLGLADEGMTMRQADRPAESDKSDVMSPEEMRAFQQRHEQQMQALLAMVQRSRDIIDVTPRDDG